MARLNESTASTESIEILKRRFVRQNREIARVNSIQSLRIRSLESEVSHLLSENVSLREQVITLTQELERLAAAKALQDGVYDVKAKLDSKLLELSNLVVELGSLPRQFSKACHENSEPASQKPSRLSESSMRNKGACSDSSVGFEADGRLPVILEDKYYPRRTLEPQELQQLSNEETNLPSSFGLEDNTLSPNLSPENDRFSPKQLADLADIKTLCDETEREHSLPPALETRRKKKIDSIQTDKARYSPESESTSGSEVAQKCGAKRKFSAEDEESFNTVPTEDDGFEFSRPVHSPLALSSQVDHSPAKRKPQSRISSSQEPPRRKALEPKNINVNVISPAKPRNAAIYDQYETTAAGDARENVFPMQAKGDVSHGKNSSPVKPDIALFNHGKAAKTRDHFAAKNVVSKKDYPSFHDTRDEAPSVPTRPSRRQRAVISYAEPNLRDKMRRSTNELVAAVGSDKPRKSSSQPLQSDATQDWDESKGSEVCEKQAQSSNITDQERDLGQMNMISQRKRKTSPAGMLGQLDESTYIQDLLKPRSPCPGPSADGDEEEQTDQSAGDMRRLKNTANDKVQAAATNGSDFSTNFDQVAIRHTRRHSSNTKSSEKSIASGLDISTLDVELEYNASHGNHPLSSSSISEVHPHPMRNNQDVEKSLQKEYGDIMAINARQSTRGKRAAARRRSMMV